VNQFQPLLYLDTDVMFNADMTDFLVDLAVSPKIMVGDEYWSRLSWSPSVGCQLFEEDPFPLPFTFGSNSGAMGIPNARRHRLHLKATVEVMLRYAAVRGKNSLRWFDQACANYVSAKLGAFDGKALAHRVEHFPNEVQSRLRHFNAVKLRLRHFSDTGTLQFKRPDLIHFWRARDKLAAMEARAQRQESERAENRKKLRSKYSNAAVPAAGPTDGQSSITSEVTADGPAKGFHGHDLR